MDENSRKQPIFGSGVYDFDFLAGYMGAEPSAPKRRTVQAC